MPDVLKNWKSALALFAGVVIVTMLIAAYAPWLSLLAGLVIISAGVAYVASDSFGDRISAARSIQSLSKKDRAIVGVPVAIYGCVLLWFAQGEIQAGWKYSAVRADVAARLELLNKAVESKQTEEAESLIASIQPIATNSEKAKLAAFNTKVEAIHRERQDAEVKRKFKTFIADGRIEVIKTNWDAAQGLLQNAISVQSSSDTAATKELANSIALGRMKLATELFDAGKLEQAKAEFGRAASVPAATETTRAKEMVVIISNKQVEKLTAEARQLVDVAKLDEAEAVVAAGFKNREATETDGLYAVLKTITTIRETAADKEVTTLLEKANAMKTALKFSQASQLLQQARSVKHTTKGSEIAIAILAVEDADKAEKQRQAAIVKAENDRIIAQMEADAKVAEEKRREEEHEVNGLVLLRKTLKGVTNEIGTEITGVIINKRPSTLKYAQVQFTLLDKSGAQVGTALANINNLESGGRWKFKAISFERNFDTYKIAELSGF